jgi:hypothetical protein
VYVLRRGRARLGQLAGGRPRRRARLSAGRAQGRLRPGSDRRGGARRGSARARLPLRGRSRRHHDRAARPHGAARADHLRNQMRPHAVRAPPHPSRRGAPRPLARGRGRHVARHVRPDDGGGDGARHAKPLLRRARPDDPGDPALAARGQHLRPRAVRLRGRAQLADARDLGADRLLRGLDLHRRCLDLAAKPGAQHGGPRRHRRPRGLARERPFDDPRRGDLLRGGGDARHLRPLRPLDGDEEPQGHERQPPRPLRHRAAGGDGDPRRRGG